MTVPKKDQPLLSDAVEVEVYKPVIQRAPEKRCSNVVLCSLMIVGIVLMAYGFTEGVWAILNGKNDRETGQVTTNALLTTASTTTESTTTITDTPTPVTFVSTITDVPSTTESTTVKNTDTTSTTMVTTASTTKPIEPTTINLPTSPTCAYGDQRQMSNGDPSKYLYCVGNQWRIQECPTGFLYDQYLKYCIEQYTTKTSPSPKTSIATSHSNGPCRESMGQEGYMPHPDCRYYYQCVHGSWMKRPCGPGTQWEQSILGCDHYRGCSKNS